MGTASDYEKKKSDLLVVEAQIYMIVKEYLEMRFQFVGVCVGATVTPLKSC